MKLEKQCCNIAYAERLKSLGVKQESLFYHTHSSWGILPKKSIDFTGDPTSAFTCAELIQMTGLSGIEYSVKKDCYYRQCLSNGTLIYFDSLSDSVAYGLIEAIINEWVDVDYVNKRLLK